MACLRQQRLVTLLGIGLALAAIGGGAPHAIAQSRMPADFDGEVRSGFDAEPQDGVEGEPRRAPASRTGVDQDFLRPVIDGDPRHPGRFLPPRYGNPPGFGAGQTGFVSTNVRRRNRTHRAAATRSVPQNPAPIVLPASDATLAPIYRQSNVPLSRLTQALRNATGDTAGMAPPQVRRRREEDPYEPIGLRVGAFILRPTVDISEGYDSNPARIENGSGSSFTLVEPELRLRSNWSRHELSANLRGSYIWYQSLSSFNRPDFNARVNGRIDITSRTRAEIEGRYQLATDTPGDPNNPSDISKPPVHNAFGGTAGVVHRFNRFELALRGTVDRTVHDDATLNNGGSLSLADRDLNQYGGQLRGSYELTPGVRPFVEIAADTRVHDIPVDFSGVQRDSDGKSIRVGSTFELTRKLTGEVSAGYLTRDYKDPTLSQLHGVIADASLIYYATPLTTATLTARSSANESTIVGVSGILNREANLRLDHSFRRWLIGTVRFGYGVEDYIGDVREDQRYNVGAALTYKLTPDVQLKGEFRRDWRRSNVPGGDYTTNIVLFGLRLQR